ncbi:CMGC kinase, MAPK family, MEK kinase-related (incomplete catalytic triad) [Toxoplasma gondii TgCatPRC2]|uniref:non-specific serine/threonine protein kinase n=1 Tax=Toxoplasma gondii TgCatPRC2 TaxID=1130821 RepID=A0A151HIG1_TOXGO|nr:CMGC kinase, MAPK family, MEK kinase-related (incomplete catalytic triad) [Toxoplasma gondii TgCatPRC2]
MGASESTQVPNSIPQGRGLVAHIDKFCRLGEGGYGVVYGGHLSPSGQPVAVKVVQRHHSESICFLRTRRSLSQIRCCLPWLRKKALLENPPLIRKEKQRLELAKALQLFLWAEKACCVGCRRIRFFPFLALCLRVKTRGLNDTEAAEANLGYRQGRSDFLSDPEGTTEAGKNLNAQHSSDLDEKHHEHVEHVNQTEQQSGAPAEENTGADTKFEKSNDGDTCTDTPRRLSSKQSITTQGSLSARSPKNSHEFVTFSTSPPKSIFESPHLLRVYGIYLCLHTGQLFTVMERLEGPPLRAYLLERHAEDLPTELEAFQIVFPVLKGLQEFHEKGFIHGDIKVENLMFRHSPPNLEALTIVDVDTLLPHIPGADGLTHLPVSCPALEKQAAKENGVGNPSLLARRQSVLSQRKSRNFEGTKNPLSWAFGHSIPGGNADASTARNGAGETVACSKAMEEKEGKPSDAWAAASLPNTSHLTSLSRENFHPTLMSTPSVVSSTCSWKDAFPMSHDILPAAGTDSENADAWSPESSPIGAEDFVSAQQSVGPSSPVGFELFQRFPSLLTEGAHKTHDDRPTQETRCLFLSSNQAICGPLETAVEEAEERFLQAEDSWQLKDPGNANGHRWPFPRFLRKTATVVEDQAGVDATENATEKGEDEAKKEKQTEEGKEQGEEEGGDDATKETRREESAEEQQVQDDEVPTIALPSEVSRTAEGAARLDTAKKTMSEETTQEGRDRDATSCGGIFSGRWFRLETTGGYVHEIIKTVERVCFAVEMERVTCEIKDYELLCQEGSQITLLIFVILIHGVSFVSRLIVGS